MGTLSFPFPVRFHHKNTNDLVGISANAIDVTGGFPNPSGPGSSIYEIAGNQFGIGEGGITVTPAVPAPAGTETDIIAPLLLSAPQTWTINGSANGTGSLHVGGEVSGPAQALSVALNNGNLTVGGDVETGAISFTGTGSVNLGGFFAGRYLVGTLNGDDGNPVSLGAGLSLSDENTTQFDKYAYNLGALTLAEDTLLEVGEPEYSAPVVLPVNGGISFSPTSRLSLSFNSQITATGPVSLNGAPLSVIDGRTMVDGSPACDVPDVNTLIETTGALNGTFGGVHDGGLISLPCGLSIDALARVNYTPHAVIATLLQRTTTSLEVSNTTPAAGTSVAGTATVTGERVGDGTAPGTVRFFDGGVPISSCTAQPLALQGAVSSASCDLSFPAAGTHNITAAYSGSPTFLASTSSTPRVIIVGPAAHGSHQGGHRRLSLLSATVPVNSGGTASVKLGCRDQTRCPGTLRLTVQRRKQKMTIASVQFSISPGRHTVGLKLNGTGRRMLVQAGGRLEATVLIGGAGGGEKRRVTLLRAGGRAAR